MSAPLQSQVTAAETEAEQVSRRRSAYEDLLTAQDLDVPDTADEFWNLREELLTEATDLLAKVERHREASTDAEYAQKAARIARDDAAKELKRVEHVGSALPEFALTMREQICAAVGVDAAELPYIAELMDLRPDQTRWRTAVEKVLRGVGLRLLVPDQHYAAVLRFVNETNMRGRLQLHHVRTKMLGAAPVRAGAEHVGGQAVRRRSHASVRRRGRRRRRSSRRPHLRRHPRRVPPVPPRGHRHRPVQGLRPAGDQGRPAPAAGSPSTCTRATCRRRSTR